MNSNDHRMIGKKYRLFSFHQEGPGLPFFHSRGIKIKDRLISYWKEVHEENGYQEIQSPILLDASLWHQSGHMKYFKENMFSSIVDKRKYVIKPMSCPGAVLVFKERKWSYKDLPLRLSELGHVHRNEDSGALHGLLRVRSFVQDDAHIFCRKDQLDQEISGVLELFIQILNRCGFQDFRFEISVRSSSHSAEGKPFLGEEEDWIFCEDLLKRELEKRKLPYLVQEGEAKFYGPSLDLHLIDAQGKSWQCSSLQLDFNLAERFNLSFFDNQDRAIRPYILHRAVFGSLERFLAILLENFGMNLPFWLLPEHLRIIVKEEDLKSEALRLVHSLKRLNVSIGLDLDYEKNLSLRIKKSFEDGVPHFLVFGKREQAKRMVDLNPFDLFKEVFD